ncbi:MAG: lasso peptide biosynthesis B2 protein [Thiocapsa sp.]|uniref:lasso peptide biosynthesis B2 protein n=1 Tax=Thiocapsa sp. TaxID=2024551 RepID=UPI001BD15F36|nr:lasso peptide biosynthesis B2 protein [Thiocapsa sp.]QVL50026.1 MAG: lasso peptide biosynthesis B2 protein [Thiocapsa sp.]
MTRLASALRRKARTFLRQPRFIQLWLVPLWFILGIGKVLIFTISFRRLAPRLGRQAGIAPWVPVLDPTQEARALLIGRAVRLAARYTPWVSNCFPQAIAARVLLGLYGLPYTLYFGLMRDPGNPAGMKAHAWVAAGRVRVTGGHSFGQFTVVGCFVSPRLTAVSMR